MDNMTTTGRVLTTLDSFGGGYGYGRGEGTHIGNGLLGIQNLRANDSIKDNGCAIAKSELGIIANSNLNASLGEIREQNRFGQMDNKIDRQTALLSAEITGIRSDITASRLEAKDAIIAQMNRDMILEGQKSVSAQHQLNDFQFPKPGAIYQPLRCHERG